MKFLQIIDNSFIGSFIGKRMRVLEVTDPQRIYVENVRSFYNIPFRLAKLLCEMAVRDRLFVKKIGIYCPDCERLILTVDNYSQIPPNIKCSTCELLEKDTFEYEESEYKIIEFYQLSIK